MTIQAKSTSPEMLKDKAQGQQESEQGGWAVIRIKWNSNSSKRSAELGKSRRHAAGNAATPTVHLIPVNNLHRGHGQVMEVTLLLHAFCLFEVLDCTANSSGDKVLNPC